MLNLTRFAAVSAFALAVAACSGAADEDELPETGMEEGAAPDAGMTGDDDMAASEGEGASDVGEGEVEGEDTPEGEPSASPTPTPSASASASPRPTPTPTQAQARVVAKPSSFTQCEVCHSVEPGQNGIGPTLAGVVGRRSGGVAGFGYSPAMRSANLTWNEANLNRFLGDPNGVVPGTTMALPGIPAADRTAIINYLKTK